MTSEPNTEAARIAENIVNDWRAAFAIQHLGPVQRGALRGAILAALSSQAEERATLDVKLRSIEAILGTVDNATAVDLQGAELADFLATKTANLLEAHAKELTAKDAEITRLNGEVESLQQLLFSAESQVSRLTAQNQNHKIKEYQI